MTKIDLRVIGAIALVAAIFLSPSLLAVPAEAVAANTGMTLSLSPSTVSYGSTPTINFTAQLKSGPSGVSGKNVSFTTTVSGTCTNSTTGSTINNCNSKTNSTGYITIKWKPSARVTSSVTVNASFAGDSSYKSSSKTATLSVNSVSLTVKSSPASVGSVTFSISFAGSTANPAFCSPGNGSSSTQASWTCSRYTLFTISGVQNTVIINSQSGTRTKILQ